MAMKTPTAVRDAERRRRQRRRRCGPTSLADYGTRVEFTLRDPVVMHNIVTCRRLVPMRGVVRGKLLELYHYTEPHLDLLDIICLSHTCKAFHSALADLLYFERLRPVPLFVPPVNSHAEMHRGQSSYQAHAVMMQRNSCTSCFSKPIAFNPYHGVQMCCPCLLRTGVFHGLMTELEFLMDHKKFNMFFRLSAMISVRRALSPAEIAAIEARQDWESEAGAVARNRNQILVNFMQEFGFYWPTELHPLYHSVLRLALSPEFVKQNFETGLSDLGEKYFAVWEPDLIAALKHLNRCRSPHNPTEYIPPAEPFDIYHDVNYDLLHRRSIRTRQLHYLYELARDPDSDDSRRRKRKYLTIGQLAEQEAKAGRIACNLADKFSEVVTLPPQKSQKH